MKKIYAIYEVVIDHIEIILCLIILGVVGLQIFTRTFLNMALKFPEEVAIFSLIAMVFVGMGVVENDNGHLRLELFQEMLPPKIKKSFITAGKLLTVVLIVYILLGEIELYPNISMLKTHAAGIPYSLLHNTMIVSSVLWLVITIAGIIQGFSDRGADS